MYKVTKTTKSWYHAPDKCEHNKKGMPYAKRCTTKFKGLRITNETTLISYVFVPKQRARVKHCKNRPIINEHLLKIKNGYFRVTTKKFPKYILKEIENYKKDFTELTDKVVEND